MESVDDTFFIPHSKPEDGSLQARNSLVREGAPPIGELGVLSHLDSFVPSVPQSSVSSVCISAVEVFLFATKCPTTNLTNHKHIPIHSLPRLPGPN